MPKIEGKQSFLSLYECLNKLRSTNLSAKTSTRIMYYICCEFFLIVLHFCCVPVRSIPIGFLSRHFKAHQLYVFIHIVFFVRLGLFMDFQAFRQHQKNVFDSRSGKTVVEKQNEKVQLMKMYVCDCVAFSTLCRLNEIIQRII